MFLLFLILFSLKTYALDAVVSVLEAPLFRTKDINSLVIQYKRKGEVIKIHPVLNDELKYDYLKPKKFVANEKFAYNEDEFIPTYDRLGNVAYVLRDHIFIYFEDDREIAQLPPQKDPTDYRIQEPLPQNYPLKIKSGYRGQLYSGLATPYNESYPYQQSVKNKGYSSPVNLSLNFLRRVSYDTQDRLYFGVSFGFSHHDSTFILTNNNISQEKAYKFGLGPVISYDAFKSKKTRITLMTSVLVNLFHQFDITQTDLNQNSEMRSYRGYSLTPTLSAFYALLDIAPHLDLLMGTSLAMDIGGDFQVDRGSRYAQWWQNPGSDSFSPRTNINVSAHLGLQSRF